MQPARKMSLIALASASLAIAILCGCRETQSLAGPPEVDPLGVEAFRVGGGCPRAGIDIIQNGGFESPRIQEKAYTLLFAGDTIGAWSVDAGAVDHISGRFWRPAEGRQSLDLDGSCGVGTISQVVAAVPGQAYQLCFALAGNPGGPPVVKSMEVWWGPERVDSLSFDTTGRTFHRMGWVYRQYTVTATTATTRLMFRSMTPGCYGPALDDIKLQEIPPTP